MSQTSLNSTGVASTGALSLQSNGTTEAIGISTGQVATLAQNPILTSGTANGVAYLNGSKVLTTGSALTFDGTNFRLNGGTLAASGYTVQTITAGVGGSILQLGDGTIDLRAQINSGGGVGYFGTYTTATPLAFTVGGTEGMRLTSTGLGIGTSSPGYKLDVNGALNLQASSTFPATGMFLRSADNQLKVIAGSSGIAFAAASGASTYATIDSSGNLGLGVTPSAWGTGKAFQGPGGSLWFRSAANGVNLVYNYAFYAGSNIYLEDGYASRYTQVSGQHQWLTAPSGTAGSAISFTQAMTLDASGNLLVGTTATGSSNLNGATLNIDTFGAYEDIGHNSTSTNGLPYARYRYSGTLIGSITQNGTTGVLYNLTSDYRLKNNQTALTGSGEFIDALQPKTWDWWDGSGKGVGFIAHEFMEVAKYSGNGEKDAVDENGAPVYQSIQPSSSEVMANLVAEIKSLRARVAQLEGN